MEKAQKTIFQGLKHEQRDNTGSGEIEGYTKSQDRSNQMRITNRRKNKGRTK